MMEALSTPVLNETSSRLMWRINDEFHGTATVSKLTAKERNYLPELKNQGLLADDMDSNGNPSVKLTEFGDMWVSERLN